MVSKAICYHLPVYLFYLFLFTYDYVNIEQGHQGFGGKFKYLTIWNVIIQTFYFGICTINDFCGSSIRPSDGVSRQSQKSSLQGFRDWLLAALAFPASLFVVTTFWGIYAVDRELVFPRELDKHIPLWMNHSEHTMILPLVLIEMFITYHHYPSKKAGISGLMFFAIAYLIWILYIAFTADLWVYPVLKVLHLHQRTAFISALLFFFIILYFIGDVVNGLFWGRETKILMQKTNKKD